MVTEQAKRIVEGIIKDLTDRRGLRQEWDLIDGQLPRPERAELVLKSSG